MRICHGVFQMWKEVLDRLGVRFLISRQVRLNSVDDGLARNEGCVSLLKMQQHPDFEAGYRRNLLNRETVLGSSREDADPSASTVEALMLISIEYTEDVVVTTTLHSAGFSVVDDRDGCSPTLVSWDDHLGRQQLELDTYRIKVSLL
jgi:hypothetical protein